MATLYAKTLSVYVDLEFNSRCIWIEHLISRTHRIFLISGFKLKQKRVAAAACSYHQAARKTK